ncbi:MAG: LicD family protein, partial [Spirochaetales bacterium]|nr:LicD family protein [Candidatus Physcosoma equi]
HAKIRRSDTTGIREVNWKSGATFNQGIFIDIYPMDVLPETEKEQDAFFKEVLSRHVKIKISEYWYKEADHPGLPLTVKHALFTLLRTAIGKKEYSRRYDALCTKYNQTDSPWLTQISEDVSLKHRFKREWFTSYEEVPFDRTTISVPKGAVEMLDAHYGNWRVPLHDGAMHGEVFYDLERPYTEYLGRYKECHGDKDELYVL